MPYAIVLSGISLVTIEPAPTSTPAPIPSITIEPEPAPAPKSSSALIPGPAHKPSVAFTPSAFAFTPFAIAPSTPVIEETPEPESNQNPEDSIDGLEKTDLNLGVEASNESRRFSQVPPASAESPNAAKLGNFAVIPTPSKEKKGTIFQF